MGDPKESDLLWKAWQAASPGRLGSHHLAQPELLPQVSMLMFRAEFFAVLLWPESYRIRTSTCRTLNTAAQEYRPLGQAPRLVSRLWEQLHLDKAFFPHSGQL